ncbi:MAG TPA: spore maturation protein [Firmicutes bacterium]|nr:spore maturation protein [Bacillota bacterium]
MLQNLLHTVAVWSIPLFLLLILVYAVYKKVDVFDTFVEGAKDGFQTSVMLIPFLVAMIVAIGLLRASGAIDLLVGLVEPLLSRFRIPGEILPLALMRPLSGSGALGITAEILNSYGPDSFVGRVASTMQGSTDTTFYILTVYFGSVGIRKIRHALVVGLIADFAAFAAALAVCKLVFG